MGHYNIDCILSAFLSDPARATGLRWEHGKGSTIWQSSQHPDGTESGRKDRIVIKQTQGGLPVIHHNGGTAESLNFWDYFKRIYNTNDNYEVILNLAECYNIQPDMSGFTEQQTQAYAKRKASADLLNMSADYLKRALSDGRAAGTRKYLQSRELTASDRLAAFSAEIKKDLREHLISETRKSAQDIDAFMQAAFPFYNADDYRLLIPYYNGTTKKCTGFVGRLTAEQTTYWSNGREVNKPKYQNSSSDIFIKGGYCTDMKAGKPVIIVEGYLDAERLKQAGLDADYNIFACGTQTPTGTGEQDAERSQIATLQRYGIKDIVYVPDYEFEADGTLRTGATQRTISAIIPYVDGRQNGNGFLSLSIAQLYNREQGDKTKQDADSFMRTFGISAFNAVIENAKPFYEWELRQAVSSLTGRDLTAKATDIYCHISSAIDRELLKQELTAGEAGYIVKLRQSGFTARYLNGIDRNGISASYRDAIAESVRSLSEAVEGKASPETIGELLKKAQNIQHRSNDAGFDAQMQTTFAQIEKMQREMPEPLQTDWQMYQYNREKQTDEATRVIEFYAKEVSFVCAPTSHGKTRFLIQMAVNFIKKHQKPILYLSLEQDAARLHELAEKAYIGTKWNGTKTPTKSLRDSIRNDDLPEELFSENTQKPLDLAKERKAYGCNIFPYLRIVKSSSDIDTICNNIRGQVEEWQDMGIDADCVVIDHMQLIDATGRSYSRTDEIKGICNALNDLAKDCGLPVIVASQFNRQAINPQGGGFEDIDTYNIAESSAIENIASDIYLVFNTDNLNDNLLSCGKDKYGSIEDVRKAGKKRTARCVYDAGAAGGLMIKPNRMYVECLKGRYNGKFHYCLLPFRPDTGYVGNAEKATDYTRNTKDNF